MSNTKVYIIMISWEMIYLRYYLARLLKSYCLFLAFLQWPIHSPCLKQINDWSMLAIWQNRVGDININQQSIRINHNLQPNRSRLIFALQKIIVFQHLSNTSAWIYFRWSVLFLLCGKVLNWCLFVERFPCC